MFDLPNKFGPGNPMVQEFFCRLSTSVAISPFQAWNKPKGANMVFFLLIGGGCGGGSGFGNVAGTARGGGAGGGSASITKYLIPASMLPDTLYVSVGEGGAGGIGAAGGQGRATRIFTNIEDAEITANIVAASTSSPPVGGAAGTGSAGGAAGAGHPAFAASGSPSTSLGLWVSQAGISGASGGSQTGAAGNDIGVPFLSIVLTGGSGGAGIGVSNTQFAGGIIAGTSQHWRIRNSIPGGIAGGGNGVNGFTFNSPIWACGGTGGGSNASGAGGQGGKGGIGCGGGGGGAGLTGGEGGAGGDGYALIACW